MSGGGSEGTVSSVPLPLLSLTGFSRNSLLIFLLLASDHGQLFFLLSTLRIPATPHSYLSSFLEVIIPLFKAVRTIRSCLLTPQVNRGLLSPW